MAIDRSSLHIELCNQKELYELHTHLLGMGNADFWVNTVLTNRAILPTNEQFTRDFNLRQRLGPLVWCQDKFVDRQGTAKFFEHLRLQPDVYFDGDQADMLRELASLELRREMDHRDLSFAKNFSYDVVINKEDFIKAFSLSNPNPDIVQTTLEEKLGVYKQATQYTSPFKYWIVFNARKQKIEIVYGMTAEELRELIGGDSAIEHIHDPAKRDARAHIINAFSMCNADGTIPRSIDYHSFRGQFTPEFYPRRFALKDSLYGQRLDILALLLQHVLRRYQTCSPPVTYCEFSIGVGDLSKAHIFDILRSFPSHDDVEKSQNIQTAFQGIVKDFPWLASKTTNEVTYRFLGGFNRQFVNLDKDANNVEDMKPFEQKKAVQLLAEAPQLAIHHMLNEITRSDDSKLFVRLIKQLADFEEVADKISSFYDWVVGLDLLGDELGFPYCPFVAKEFITHVGTRRSKGNSNYGLRIHGGENVAVVHSALPGYHLFVSHMYIVLLSIEYLKQKLDYGIRVGHGVAFNIIFNYEEHNESSSRKSSVLMAEMKELSRNILQNTALEVNITSNFYLLGESVRREEPVRRVGIGEQTHSLNRFFDPPRVPIVLSTDNDGIWPLDQCLLKHFGHHSLAAEYCRAIYSGIIHTKQQLDDIVDDSKKYCFDKDRNTSHKDTTKSTIESNNRFRNPMVTLHPKLIRYILENLYDEYTETSDKPFYKYCFAMYPNRIHNEYKLSKEQCDNLAPIALAISYLTHSEWGWDSYKAEYNSMFRASQRRHYQKHEDVKIKCEQIYLDLMEKTTDSIQADYSMIIEGNKEAASTITFMSMQPSSDDQTARDIIERLNECPNDSSIFGFCSKLDMKETLAKLKETMVKEASEPEKPSIQKKNLTVFLRSNMNKYDYTDGDKITEITFKANYHPDVRTNCDKEVEEHALYAICPHGSAATAALHHIAKYERIPSTYLETRYIKLKQSDEDTEAISKTTSAEISTTTTTASLTTCNQYPDTESYKRSCILRPFNQLIIPFLPMKVNVPFFNYSHFYELYNIEDSSKLADKFEFQDSSSLFYHIDKDYHILFDDAVHSRMNWPTLYKEFRNENTSVDLIQAMLHMTLDSLQQYDVCPTLFALLRTTTKRETLRKNLEQRHLNILVPIKNIDKGSKLLVCTQVQRFPFRTQELKFSVTNRLSFDIAHILWINVNQGKPFKTPHFELNNTIVLHHMSELQEIARRFMQPDDDVWGYFIILTILEASIETWDPISINKWCDFLYDALPNNEIIDKFAKFISSHKLWETFKLTLDDSPGRLSNDEQLNVIKRRKAYEIRQRLLSKLKQQDSPIETRSIPLRWHMNVRYKQQFQYTSDVLPIKRTRKNQKLSYGGVYLQGSDKRSYPSVQFDIPTSDLNRKWFLQLYIVTECDEHTPCYIHPWKGIFADHSLISSLEGATESENYIENPHYMDLTTDDIIRGTFEIKRKVVSLKKAERKQAPLTECFTKEPFTNVQTRSSRISATANDYPLNWENFHLACVLLYDDIECGFCISDLMTNQRRNAKTTKTSANWNISMETENPLETASASNSNTNLV